MVSAIIVAAGSGTRMGQSLNKVFLDLGQAPILFHSLAVFMTHPRVDEVIVVLKKEEIDLFWQKWSKSSLAIELEKNGQRKALKTVEGGNSRGNSVKNGVAAISDHAGRVLIHDGARPFINKAFIDALISASSPAAVPVLAVKDTLLISTDGQMMENKLSRESLRAIQTPQSFEVQSLRKILQELPLDKSYTDESSLFFDEGFQVELVDGLEENFKITTPLDLLLAEQLIDE